MPCRSDHMEPRAKEAESRKVAGHLCYLLPLVKAPVSESLKRTASHIYGSENECDSLTAQLCSLIRSLSESESDRFIYNGRNADARKLADWWERHQEVDRLREEQEEADRVAAMVGINQALKDQKKIAMIWSIGDVQGLRPDLTEDQCWEVLQSIGRHADCEHGISWETLRYEAEDMYPKPVNSDQLTE